MKLFRRSNPPAQKRFESLLEQGSVPSFPKVVADALQKIASPDVELAEVARTISADPSLTVAVLSLANSPAFAPRSPIASVHQAIVLLGRDQLESLLIASGVAEALPSQPTPGYEPRQFWLDSAFRAGAAAAMAAAVDPSTQYDQFTAALLQDMAQPILLHHDKAYADLLQQFGDSPELPDQEREEFGWTHPEIGELLCTEWGLPDSLSHSVSIHHDQEPVPGFEIAQWASLIEGADSDVEELVQEAQERFGLDEEAVLAVLEQAKERAAELAGIFA